MLKLQSTVVSDTLVKAGVTCARQPLTGMDILHGQFGIPVMLVYPQGLDLDKLKAGLIELLKKYPLIGGQLVKGEDGQVYIDGNDTGVHWLVKQCKGPTPVGEHRPPLEDIKAFYKPLMPWQAVGKGLPVFQVNLHQFEDGGTVMVMRAPHSIFDGSGAFGFLMDWSRACYGFPIFGQNFDRNEFIGLSKDTPLPTERLAMLSRPSLLAFMSVMVRLGWRALFHIRKEVFRIPAAQVKAWQEEAKAEAPEASQLSAAKLVSAYVMKAIDPHLPKAKPRYLGSVLDMRFVKGLGLSRNYFGNALCYPECKLGATEVRDLPLLALARKLSPNPEQTSVDYLRKVAAVLEDARQRKDVPRLLLGPGAHNLDASIFQNNCSQLPVYEFDFGTGRPRWYDTMPMTIRMMTLLPTPDRDGGIDIHFCASKAERDALRRALAKDGFAPHPGQLAKAA
ncbi:MAG: hypothetical protein RI907_3155 [Pseudomonadota bacterium]|jgi:hypothetical protein